MSQSSISLTKTFNPLINNGKKVVEIAARFSAIVAGEALFSVGGKAAEQISENILSNPQLYTIPVSTMGAGVTLFALGVAPREITKGMNRVLGME